MEDLYRLTNTAKWRWLKPSEVFFALRSYPSESIPTLSSYESFPVHGDLFFVRKNLFKRWKKDGHEYLSRKSGTGIREDRDKYSDEIDTVQCVYVHGGGVCLQCKKAGIMNCEICNYPITPLTFHRRAYWLTNCPEVVLVHYLDESMRSSETMIERKSSRSTVESNTSSKFQYENPNRIRLIEDTLRKYELEEVPKVTIIDYTPEWGEISGGTKILICVDPAIMVPHPHLLVCMFGEISVHVESAELGTFRCYSPSHPAGTVDLYLVYENNDITLNRQTFEYKEITVMSEMIRSDEWWTEPAELITQSLLETISEISQDTVISLEDFDYECFFYNLNYKPKAKILNSKGVGIIHYSAVLNFEHFIRMCESAGFDLNLKTMKGETALELASYLNNTESIIALLELGADITRCELDKTSALLHVFSKIVHELSSGSKKFSEEVELIQKNVRKWLYKKELDDIKMAAKRLQSAVRCMLARKHFKFEKKSAILIEKTVRKWLKSSRRAEWSHNA